MIVDHIMIMDNTYTLTSQHRSTARYWESDSQDLTSFVELSACFSIVHKIGQVYVEQEEVRSCLQHHSVFTHFQVEVPTGMLQDKKEETYSLGGRDGEGRGGTGRDWEEGTGRDGEGQEGTGRDGEGWGGMGRGIVPF